MCLAIANTTTAPTKSVLTAKVNNHHSVTITPIADNIRLPLAYNVGTQPDLSRLYKVYGVGILNPSALSLTFPYLTSL